MRYECLFANPDNINDHRTIFVDLNEDEVLRECENYVQVCALALMYAYRVAPKNWQHVRGCVMPVVH